MRIYLLILLSLTFLYGQDGCTDPTACNYDPAANEENGTCLSNGGGYVNCKNEDGIDNGTTGCDCNNYCGGSAGLDECGNCIGGNTGQIFNDAMDDCDVCNGPGKNIPCWDGSLVCDTNDCPFNPDDCRNGTTGTPDGTYTLMHYNNICVPTPHFSSVNQSSQQAFYYISSVTMNGEPIDADDWVGAFNGNVCVGARKWDTVQCGGICDLPLMGFDTTIPDLTEGYMRADDIPTFQIYDASENQYYYAQASEINPWQSSVTFDVANLNAINTVPLSIYDQIRPDKYKIHNIYPNPFNPITSIDYSLPENASIELFVYNIHGRYMQTLVQGFQTAGYHSINWNAQNYPSGVYLIRLESGIYGKTQKVVLIK